MDKNRVARENQYLLQTIKGRLMFLLNLQKGHITYSIFLKAEMKLQHLLSEN